MVQICDDKWAIVDSCIDDSGAPVALKYLQSIGVDVKTCVPLIVITHWHDDHIRGISKLVEECSSASVCLPIALSEREFLAFVGVIQGTKPKNIRSGVSEIYGVYEALRQRSSRPIFAIANRSIFSQYGCHIWALSPRDSVFASFLEDIAAVFPAAGMENKISFTSGPNKVAVALLVRLEGQDIILGSDVERSQWHDIVLDTNREQCDATVFKVPHHGSFNAHEIGVWNSMLRRDPIAVVTPWRLGGGELPMRGDVSRICSLTSRAYATSSRPVVSKRVSKQRHPSCRRLIRASRVKLGSMQLGTGMIRLRANTDGIGGWTVETLGAACRLDKY